MFKQINVWHEAGLGWGWGGVGDGGGWGDKRERNKKWVVLSL